MNRMPLFYILIKFGMSPRQALTFLKTVSESLKRSQIAKIKSFEPQTVVRHPYLSPQDIVVMTFSPRKLRKEIAKVRKLEKPNKKIEARIQHLKKQTEFFYKGLTPKEREIMGRLALFHEALEAKETKRLLSQGLFPLSKTHASPLVLEEELKVLEGLYRDFPKVVERVAEHRFMNELPKFIRRYWSTQFLPDELRQVAEPIMISFMDALYKYKKFLK